MPRPSLKPSTSGIEDKSIIAWHNLLACVVTIISSVCIRFNKNVLSGPRFAACIQMNITKLIRAFSQFSSLTCQEVWTYMDVSYGIRTTDPHMTSIHGFVDFLELSFPAFAVILSICPRTGNWAAVCTLLFLYRYAMTTDRARCFKR